MSARPTRVWSHPMVLYDFAGLALNLTVAVVEAAVGHSWWLNAAAAAVIAPCAWWSVRLRSRLREVRAASAWLDAKGQRQ